MATFDDMDEEELAAALDQQVLANNNLQTENTLLENFLHRNGAANIDFSEAARRDAKKKNRGGGGEHVDHPPTGRTKGKTVNLVAATPKVVVVPPI